jgi:hypothetical protein
MRKNPTQPQIWPIGSRAPLPSNNIKPNTNIQPRHLNLLCTNEHFILLSSKWQHRRNQVGGVEERKMTLKGDEQRERKKGDKCCLLPKVTCGEVNHEPNIP